MKAGAIYFLLFIFLFSAANGLCAEAPVSGATQECLDCHGTIHPGIVESWRQSRHARITPKEALSVKGTARKVSSLSISKELQSVAVGCAECHTLRPRKHKDTVEHNGHEKHVVVSPDDCATCHTEEAGQYSKNIMAHAYNNLAGNPVYQALQRSILGQPVRKKGAVQLTPSHVNTQADACYYCHGTRLEVSGFETKETDMGEMKFAVLSGWPNQGVGRLNLDGSKGACSACHTRHTFSIEMARKPYTCKECHVGPDVPAFKVYTSSKHGNIFSAMNSNWNFQAVPWTVGQDFKAPTCATCHVSLLVNTEGEMIAERTHQMSDRLSWRIFGLIYAHPQPKEPDTSIIRNTDGLPLPTDFGGGFAQKFLIDSGTQQKRTESMQAICKSCHHNGWVRGHWKRYEHTIKETNAAIGVATQIMADIWKGELAQGLNQGGSPFDEAVEKKWSDIWLFYANTIRFSSAMAGGGDFGVFADGRYHLSKEIQKLNDWLKLRTSLVPAKK
jgi:hypothetical protein